MTRRKPRRRWLVWSVLAASIVALGFWAIVSASTGGTYPFLDHIGPTYSEVYDADENRDDPSAKHDRELLYIFAPDKTRLVLESLYRSAHSEIPRGGSASDGFIEFFTDEAGAFFRVSYGRPAVYKVNGQASIHLVPPQACVVEITRPASGSERRTLAVLKFLHLK